MFEENCKGIISALADAPYDAVLLTSPQNRFYATGFHSSAGIALLSARPRSVCDGFSLF